MADSSDASNKDINVLQLSDQLHKQSAAKATLASTSTDDAAGSGKPADRERLRPSRQYVCPHCSKLYSSSSNLSKHKRRVHPAERMAVQASLSNSSDASCKYGRNESEASPERRKRARSKSPRVRRGLPTRNNDSDTPQDDSRVEDSDCTSLDSVERLRLLKETVDAVDGVEESDDEDATAPDEAQHLESDSDVDSSDGNQGLNHKLSQYVEPCHRPTTALECTKYVDTSAAEPFFHWLQEFPVTEAERLVKMRRVTDAKQLTPIKCNIKFIFAILIGQGVCADGSTIALSILAQHDVCRKLFEGLKQRNAGPCRVHALFLLVKKVLVYLSAQESLRLRQYVPPTVQPSFAFVCSLVSEATTTRKANAADRALLGPITNVHGPTLSSSSSSSSSLSSCAAAHAAPAAADGAASGVGSSSASCAASSSSASSSSSTLTSSVRSFPSQQPMSKAEMSAVASGCIRYLTACTQDGRCTCSVKECLRYSAYLVTLFLLAGFAPRSQVLAQLQLGTSFVHAADTNEYWVRLRSEQSKNGRPVLLKAPQRLTPFFSHYVSVVRPSMLRLTSAPAGGDGNYLFLKQSGRGPRESGFSDFTRFVTRTLISREVTAHAFRSSVITAYYEAGASQSQMTDLARLMSHDPVTARNFYYRPLYTETMNAASSKLDAILFAPPTSPVHIPAAHNGALTASGRVASSAIGCFDVDGSALATAAATTTSSSAEANKDMATTTAASSTDHTSATTPASHVTS